MVCVWRRKIEEETLGKENSGLDGRLAALGVTQLREGASLAEPLNEGGSSWLSQ